MLQVKKRLIGFVILFVALNLSAQDKEANAKVTGKVMDSLTNTPLEYATISLFKPGDKKQSTEVPAIKTAFYGHRCVARQLLGCD